MPDPRTAAGRIRLAGAATLLLGLAPFAATAADVKGWQFYGGDEGGSHYSSLATINRDNVHELTLAWSYRTGDIERYPERRGMAALNVTPILLPEPAGHSLVLCTSMNRVIALDPLSGEERWSYDPEIILGPMDNKFLCRGVAYWQDTAAEPDAVCTHRVFTGTKDLRLIAIDARTGKPCEDFGARGTVDIRPDIYDDVPDLNEGDVQFSAPPVVIDDLVIIGSADNTKFWRADNPSGEVRAFDARTGEPRWSFDPIPRDADAPAAQDWTAEAMRNTGGANVWSMMSVDAERGLMFLPTATAGPNNFGGLSSRRQSLRKFSCCAERGGWQRRLAFPDPASRCLGPGSARATDTGRPRTKRPDDTGRNPADQAGADLRASPGDRRAGIRGRGTAGTDRRRAGRGAVADTAISDPAGAVRQVALHTGRCVGVHIFRP